jgi:glucose-1-phosphate cytidylyltransferase
VKIPVALLAGGLGTRLREETEIKPKPMVEIGGKPVLWHLMKNLSEQNCNEFIICTGYKSEVIKDYFLNYNDRQGDITVSLGVKNNFVKNHFKTEENWTVTVADTGALTPTGGRIHKIRNYINNRRFIVTYGDGLADVDISKLLRFHESHGKIATVTTYQPFSRFGLMDIASDGLVNNFREKPKIVDWVNIGFFIFEPEIFEYLDENSVLEEEPLRLLARERELFAYQHEGFWEPMDTFREYSHLNSLWDSGKAKWKNW